MKRIPLALLALGLGLASSSPAMAQTRAKQPNILVIWGDDVGYWNVSAYNQGLMGYKTPNIDRDLLKVGLPGAKEGLQARDVTMAELLIRRSWRRRATRT